MKGATETRRTLEQMRSVRDQIIEEARLASPTLLSQWERYGIFFVEMTLELDYGLGDMGSRSCTATAMLQVEVQIGPSAGFGLARFQATDLEPEALEQVTQRVAAVSWLTQRWDKMARELCTPGPIQGQALELLDQRAREMNSIPF